MANVPDNLLVQPIDDETCQGCGRPFNIPIPSVPPVDEGCRKCGHTKYAHTVDYGLGRRGCKWKHPTRMEECICLHYEAR